MKYIAVSLAAVIVTVSCGDPSQPDTATAPSFGMNEQQTGVVVRVRAPTGDPAADVANIEDAVAAATPGGVIQFAPGTYRIRPTTSILVSVPRVTLQGHHDGTTIRGGFNPDIGIPNFVLNGRRQAVRHLTFERFSFALLLGESGTTKGGYRVEDCTFRNGDTPFQFNSLSDEVSTVWNNEIINVSQGFAVLGKTVHVRGNRITAPDPGATPFGQPFFAGFLAPDFQVGGTICENNVFEENTIVNNADGFIIAATGRQRCRNNVIRRNTFIGQRVFTEFDNGSIVWAAGPGVRGNLIEENLLRGSQGLGVYVDSGSHNRIVGNEFRNLPGKKEIFTPFPGTAIVLGEPTSGNRVIRNEFHNVVEGIVDLGTGNFIRGNDENRGSRAQSHAQARVPKMTGQQSQTMPRSKARLVKERLRN